MTGLEYRRQPGVTNLLNALWSFCGSKVRITHGEAAVVPNPAGQSLHVTRIPRVSFSGFSLSFQLSRSVGCQKLHIALSVFVTLLNMDLVRGGLQPPLSSAHVCLRCFGFQPDVEAPQGCKYKR